MKPDNPANASAGANSPSRPWALYATNVDTGDTRRIAVLPPRSQIGLATVNADESLAAGTYLEGEGYQYGSNSQGQTHPLDQPRNKGQMME